MRQPMIKFLNYFPRVNEIKEIKKRNARLSSTLSGVAFIDDEDKKVIAELIDMLAMPKKKWLVQPLDVKGTDIPWVRSVQEVIAKYLAKASNEQEMNFVQELFRASEDFFRYQEMFEQNVLFLMFVVTLFTVILAPILIVLV